MVDSNWTKFLHTGDVNAFSNFYNSRVNDLYSYGLSLSFSKEICRDAIQDVFCKIFVDKDKLMAVDNIKAYLFRIYRNRLVDIYKELKKTEIFLSSFEFPFETEVDAVGLIIDAEETEKLKQRVEILLASLTARQREAVYLRYMQQMDYDEIAPILNLSPESARKLIHRAMVKLRENAFNHAEILVLSNMLGIMAFGSPLIA